jgi:hypothetical protein
VTYDARANLHRPKTLDEIRAAVHALLADGMSDYDTAAALQIAVEQVRRFAAEPCEGRGA